MSFLGDSTSRRVHQALHSEAQPVAVTSCYASTSSAHRRPRPAIRVTFDVVRLMKQPDLFWACQAESELSWGEVRSLPLLTLLGILFRRDHGKCRCTDVGLY